MSKFRTIALGFASTAVVASFAVAPAATAAPHDSGSEPCARQQAQADKADAKLAALTQKFEEHPTQSNKKAKKAQAQRAAHAHQRLDACLAG